MCERCNALVSEIKALRAERDRLQQKLDGIYFDDDELKDQIASLKSHNDKLREEQRSLSWELYPEGMGR